MLFRALIIVSTAALVTLRAAVGGPHPMPHAPGIPGVPGAAGVPAPPEPFCSLIAGLPRDVDVVAVVRGASGLRQAPSGQAVQGALGAIGVLRETGAAWRGLAERLRWSETDAFDRLLGSGVVLVVRRRTEAPADEAPEWALITRVDTKTERHLRARLDVAPRTLAGGGPIMSIEHGRYELARQRGPGAERDRAGATLILGPSDRPGLFDELVEGRARRAEDRLDATPLIREAPDLCTFDAVLLVEGSKGDPAAEPAGGGAARWDNAVVIGANQVADGWNASIRVRDRSMGPDLAGVPPSTDGLFNALAHDALLAIVESRLPMAEADQRRALLKLLPRLDLPRPVEDRLGARKVLHVKACEDRGGLDITSAVEVVDPAGVSPEVDQLALRLIDLIETSQPPPGPRPGPAPAFTGLAPSALRVVELAVAPDGLVAGLAGQTPNLRWRVVSRAEPAGSEASWWTMTLGPPAPGAPGDCADASHAVTATLLGLHPDGQRARWLSRGVVLPAALRAAMPRRTMPIESLDAVLRRIARVEWSIEVTGAADLSGMLRVRLESAP